MGNMEKPSLQKMLINFCSEFGGTYILVFLGCMGCVAGLSGGSIPHEQISFVFGFAVLIAVQCFGHVSGGHINPIVTVASVVLGNTPIAMAPVYILGQFVGAIAGYGSVMLVTPSVHLGNQVVGGVKSPGVCSPALNPQLSPVQGLAVEFIASSMLILVCCAVWDRKNSDKHDSVSVRFGLTIAVLAMAAGPYSGANMNPARSFAPALLNGDWSNHWIYWVGPLLAGTVTTWVYKYLFNTPPPEDKLPESIPLN